MATFEDDSFLADLDELSENELAENDAQKEEEEEEEDETSVNYDDLDSVSKLQKTQRFSDIMKKVEEALDFDSEYNLILDCNKLLVQIDKEIVILHNFIRHNYKLKSPLLERIVPRAFDYARVVKRIGNETDLNLVHLDDLIPIPIFITGLSICEDPLPKDVQEKTIEACDRVLDLDSSKKKFLEFVDIKTRFIAPNLSAIVGSKVATKLMVSSAGGLSALAKTSPTCVGHKRKKSVVAGFLNETEIVRNTPPRYKNNACELLAAKLTLAARVDSTRGDSSGEQGRDLRDEVLKEINKLQEPPNKRRVAVPGTMLIEKLVEEQSSPHQSLEQGDETPSKYFSKFGTFSKINKRDKVFKF